MIKKISEEYFSDITRKLKELQTLYDLYKITSSTLNLNELLNLIMELTLNAVEAEVGLILLYGKGTEKNYPKVTWGLTKEIIDGIIYKDKIRLIDWLNKKSKPLVIKNLDKNKNFKYSARKNIFVKSLLFAPLCTKNRKIGAIILANKSLPNGVTNFTQDDLHIFQTISGQISVAIENSQLYEEVVEIKNFSLGIINSINIGVITTSLDKKITTFNKKAEFIFNIHEEDVIGKPVKILFDNLEKGKKNVILEALDRSENLLNLEAELRFPNGETKILSLSTSNLKGGEDKIIGYIISVDDISERKMLENQILRSEQLAALGELSAGIAHEIKNPLTSIKGFTQLLSSKLDDKNFLLKYADVIHREVDRLNNIIEELLQFAKPKVKGFARVNLKEILDRALALLKYQIEKADINIVLNLLPIPDVYGDAQQIEQVFINIILNAIQAMKHGGKLEIESKVIVKKSPENIYYEYSVLYFTDTGKGIKPEHIDKLFNPFFTTKPKGSGLGLSISHRIVTEHKGTIEVISKVGKGTTFIISIPTVNNY